MTKELRVRFLKAQLGAGVFRSALGTFHAPGFHLIVVLLCSGFTRFCFCFGRNFPRLFVPFSAIFPGFLPLVSLFLQGIFRGFSPFFPGVTPRAKGSLGSDSSFISVEGLGFRPSIPFPGSRYPFLDNYFWTEPQPVMFP